ncbi:sialate O-acetylesterase [Stenotrophomonas maltophilia]|uniref:sialate O-acetylesterase n=1 Tax=Stenotrophomonas maltophilia TaxID=40324 RepID=UPI0015DDA033|nr:sialate O-acetylesterase [Stenotrophomonas maltophilia]MBA0449313.1 hypothetical protein [Stenotrophomonas maltophilia]
MTTFNTGNPVPSTAVKDLYDNAQNLDAGINGPGQTWLDRKGQTRKSWSGIETDFQAFLADGSTIEFPTWAAASAAGGAGQIPLNRQVAVIGDTGSHTDPVSGLTVPNSGRYVMVAAGLEWRSPDVLTQKADRNPTRFGIAEAQREAEDAAVAISTSETSAVDVARSEMWGQAGNLSAVAAGEQSATGTVLAVNVFRFWVQNFARLPSVTLEIYKRMPGGPGGMPPLDATLMASVTLAGADLSPSDAEQEIEIRLPEVVSVTGPEILIWKLSSPTGGLVIGRNTDAAGVTQFRRGWYTQNGGDGLVISPNRLAYSAALRTVVQRRDPEIDSTLQWWVDRSLTLANAYCNRDTGAIVATADFRCAVVPAVEGDQFQVTATVVGSVAALAVFRNASGAAIGFVHGGASGVYVDYTDELVTCPADTASVVFTTRANNVPGRINLDLAVKAKGIYPNIAETVSRIPALADVNRQQQFDKVSASYGGYSTTWRAPAEGICYILPTLGQSNALGVNVLASDPITGSNAYPSSCLMFSGGLRYTQDTDQTLIPVAESFNAAQDLGQTAAMSWATHLRRDVEALTGHDSVRTISFVSALGTTALPDLTRGSTQYKLFLAAVRRASRICRDNGWSPVVPAIDWMQGERDSTWAGMTKGRRSRTMQQFARFLCDDIKAATGQVDTPVLLVSQTSHANSSTWNQPIRESDYELDGVDNIRLAGPIYQFPMSDTIHLDCLGQYRRGAQLARATINEVLGDGQRTIRVVRSRWVDATHLDVTFDCNVFPLVVDGSGDTIATAEIAGSAGFIVDDGTGSPPVVTSAATTGTFNGVVRLTLSAAPATQRIRLGYAVQRNSDAGGQNGPLVGARGLLRDSMVVTDEVGAPSYNWCPAFIVDL